MISNFFSELLAPLQPSAAQVQYPHPDAEELSVESSGSDEEFEALSDDEVGFVLSELART